jgi:tRNA threonylcarbamoyladenosine biosynthesis protein TsaE
MNEPVDNPVSFALDTRRATRHLARALAALLGPSDLVILDGQLGCGKTFFVRALCRSLGLSERIRVTSPTFALVHELATQPKIAHADLYRLASKREVNDLGLLERRDRGELVIVEWGMPYVDILGGDALVFEFKHDPRRILPRVTGQRSEAILAALLLREGLGDLVPIVGASV